MINIYILASVCSFWVYCRHYSTIKTSSFLIWNGTYHQIHSLFTMKAVLLISKVFHDLSMIYLNIKFIYIYIVYVVKYTNETHEYTLVHNKWYLCFSIDKNGRLKYIQALVSDLRLAYIWVCIIYHVDRGTRLTVLSP